MAAPITARTRQPFSTPKTFLAGSAVVVGGEGVVETMVFDVRFFFFTGGEVVRLDEDDDETRDFFAGSSPSVE